MQPGNFVLITPARNEEATIEVTINSVLAQTIRPKEWIIVSDSSTDRTDDIVKRFAASNSFIKLLRLDKRPSRNFASVVFATEAGCHALQTRDYAFLGLFDADIRFQPTYFEKLLEHFEADSSLGLAGGLVLDVTDGLIPRQFQNLREVAGAVHFFRRECYESIGGLIAIPEGGWDTITGVQARSNGYATRTFPELVVEHLKPRNTGEGGSIKRKWQMGVRAYAVGSHPLFEFVKCGSRILEAPLAVGAAARFAGFAYSAVSRRKRVLAPSLIKDVRKEQLARLLPFRSEKVSTPTRTYQSTP